LKENETKVQTNELDDSDDILNRQLEILEIDDEKKQESDEENKSKIILNTSASRRVSDKVILYEKYAIASLIYGCKITHRQLDINLSLPYSGQIRQWNNTLSSNARINEGEFGSDDDVNSDTDTDTDLDAYNYDSNLMEALSRIRQFDSIDNVMKTLCEEFHLGKDQYRAVHKIISHVINFEQKKKTDPLHLLITGEAGTGKSKIIECVDSFFKYSANASRSSYHRITASTGTASAKLFASTIHGFLSTETDERRIKKEWISKFQDRLKDLQYLVIDEISMIGGDTLLKIDQRLRLAKNNEKMFGDVSIIVFGDFFQFPPVRQKPFFVKQSPAFYLWRECFKDVIILKENFRQKGDKKYHELLQRWLRGEISEEDLDFLESKQLFSFSNNNFDNLDKVDISDSTIIVSRNSLRNTLNNYFCQVSNESVCEEFTASDKSKKNFILHDDTWEYLKGLPDSETNMLPGVLKVFKGMRVMITSNICPQLGISKGTRGSVVGWNDIYIFVPDTA
jgi:hypothetical protein